MASAISARTTSTVRPFRHSSQSARFREADVRKRTHPLCARGGPHMQKGPENSRETRRNTSGTSFGHPAPVMMPSCAVQPRILIADDQADLLDALRLLLKNEGIEMETVTSPEAVIEAIATRTFDLLLMDLNYTGDTTSGREGIDLLARVQELDALLPVVVMTGWGSVDLAVEAMRRGVRDFVQKPWDNSQLVATLRSEIEEGRARRQRIEHEERELQEALRIQ